MWSVRKTGAPVTSLNPILGQSGSTSTVGGLADATVALGGQL